MAGRQVVMVVAAVLVIGLYAAGEFGDVPGLRAASFGATILGVLVAILGGHAQIEQLRRANYTEAAQVIADVLCQHQDTYDGLLKGAQFGHDTPIRKLLLDLNMRVRMFRGDDRLLQYIADVHGEILQELRSASAQYIGHWVGEDPGFVSDLRQLLN